MKKNNVLIICITVLALALIASATTVIVNYIRFTGKTEQAAQAEKTTLQKAQASQAESVTQTEAETSTDRITVSQRVDNFYKTLQARYDYPYEFNRDEPLVYEATEMMNAYYDYCREQPKSYLETDDEEDGGPYIEYQSFIYAGMQKTEEEERYIFFDGNLYESAEDSTVYYSVSVEKKSIRACVMGSEYWFVWKNGKSEEDWKTDALAFFTKKYPQYKDKDLMAFVHEDCVSVNVYSNINKTFFVDYGLSTVKEERFVDP